MITSYAGSQPLSFYVAIFIFTLVPWAIRFSWPKLRKGSVVPLANPPESLFGTGKTRRSFVKLSREILAKARNLFPDEPFRLITDWGEVLILPPEFADEIRNDPRLSFSKAAMQDNHAGIPGFETVALVGREDQLIQKVARKQLTKHLFGIITPLIERRRELRRAAIAAGQPLPVFHDAIDWSEQEAEAAGSGSAFDPVIFQLTLSLLAIHTTYDLLQQTMIDLGRHPEYIEPVRQEVVQLLREEGWKKTTLFKMKLLDSAIKESQRMKPGSIVTMRRYVTEDITLSSGLTLQKGTRLNVDNRRLDDPKIYENPEVYNPYRFYDMRSEAGKDHGAQLVSTGSNHMGFGHGQHSCPGRFFAANEIKVALCHILVKYDWKLCPDTETKPDTRGMIAKSSPVTDILIKRRESVELDLEAI
ncbi:hypothetical protein NW756_012268 [Fusarium oxysporum]|nr:hypothetical protein NW753_011479 [Fusarium oxysporum]KAJ4048397.1 hypothetical protein NW763_009811 [Fusarium oxysporum]KAJ4077408.1 hypothetical protein NW756_012268 [Fusarium oxysporum]